MTIRIDNRQARALWLFSQGLATAPTGPLDVMSIVKQLGFVQLDTIQVVVRAHHHIIWSRNQNYREPMLNELLAKERLLFEHFTHDASVIPMQFLPMWQRQFRRMKENLDASRWYSAMLGSDGREAIKARIRREGSLSTHAFETKIKGPKQMWSRPPHKLALDYMWYAGELATCKRVNFTKYYDLAENVFPSNLLAVSHSDVDQINWLCSSALERIGAGTPGEIQRFWDAVSAKEVKEWIANSADSLTAVEIQAADGSWADALAPNDIAECLSSLKPPTSRLRILNPFDPAVRDRNRLERLFGFEYRVEMFVPKAKRRWGYYVYPILEGDRFVGRIEMKADRSKNSLIVQNIWPEKSIVWSTVRADKLRAEVNRMARFVSIENIVWNCPNTAKV
ncbi:MAG: crosslink repair DNA glycosylase YcaQ family protein [Paracoccaceae bacterium]